MIMYIYHYYPSKSLGLIALLSCFLTGCTDGGSMRTSSSIIGEGWASPPEPFDPPALYCYKTIGAHDCYALPIADGQSRIIGKYEGPPSTPLENIDNDVIIKNISLPDDDATMNISQDIQRKGSVRQAPIESRFEESVNSTKPHNHYHKHHHKQLKHKHRRTEEPITSSAQNVLSPQSQPLSPNAY